MDFSIKSMPPQLSEQQIVEFINYFIERCGKTPTNKDKAVWRKHHTGEWILIENLNWKTIDTALKKGRYGLPGGVSLDELKEQYNFSTLALKTKPSGVFSEERLIKLIGYYVEITGTQPSIYDNEVFDKDENGNWVLLDQETWFRIHMDLKNGLNGLPGNSALAKFKEEKALEIKQFIKSGFSKAANTQNMVSDLPCLNAKRPETSPANISNKETLQGTVLLEAKIKSFARRRNGINAQPLPLPDAKAPPGKPPQKRNKVINFRGAASAIYDPLPQRNYEHVSKVKRPDFDEEKIISWIKLFHEKYGKYPLITDQLVWEKTDDGKWTLVEGKSWEIIDNALFYGNKWLPGGISLRELKIKEGLINDPHSRKSSGPFHKNTEPK